MGVSSSREGMDPSLDPTSKKLAFNFRAIFCVVCIRPPRKLRKIADCEALNEIERYTPLRPDANSKTEGCRFEPCHSCQYFNNLGSLPDGTEALG